MAYKEKIYRFKDSTEYEFTYAGKYGAKGERRAPKRKPTKEQIQRQNQTNKEIRIRRLIKANFSPGDLWVCLKYPKGYRATLDEVKKDFRKFRDMIRKAYADRGKVLKYIYRLEIGERGGIHIHILVNRIWNAQTDIVLMKAWEEVLKRRVPAKKAAGFVDYKNVYDVGGYAQLAEYICKTPKEDTEEYKQLSLFAPVQQKQLLSVQTSRNLIRPEPEVRTCCHWNMRRILENGWPKPKKGYYIEKESVVSGINPYTGMSYLKYTEVRIKSKTERGQP